MARRERRTADLLEVLEEGRPRAAEHALDPELRRDAAERAHGDLRGGARHSSRRPDREERDADRTGDAPEERDSANQRSDRILANPPHQPHDGAIERVAIALDDRALDREERSDRAERS